MRRARRLIWNNSESTAHVQIAGIQIADVEGRKRIKKSKRARLQLYKRLPVVPLRSVEGAVAHSGINVPALIGGNGSVGPYPASLPIAAPLIQSAIEVAAVRSAVEDAQLLQRASVIG